MIKKKNQVVKSKAKSFFDNASVNEIRNHIIKHSLKQDGENVKTTSLDFVKITGKRHADVLRMIDNILLECSELDERNFALISYKDNLNRQKRAYEMDFKGFNILMGRMTGKVAIKYQLAFQNAFQLVIDKVKNLALENAQYQLETKNNKLLIAEQDLCIYSAQNQKLWIWLNQAHANFLKVSPKKTWGEVSKVTGLPKKQLIGAHYKTAPSQDSEHPQNYLNSEFMLQAQQQIEMQNNVVQGELL